MTIDYLQFPLSDYLNCNLLKDVDIKNLKGNSKILSLESVTELTKSI